MQPTTVVALSLPLSPVAPAMQPRQAVAAQLLTRRVRGRLMAHLSRGLTLPPLALWTTTVAGPLRATGLAAPTVVAFLRANPFLDMVRRGAVRERRALSPLQL